MNLKAIPAKFLGLFLAEKSPGPLAAAVALGLFLGLVPILSLQALLVLAIVCFCRVNLSWTVITFAIFKGISVVAGGAFDALGVVLLEIEGLRGLWAWLYHSPLSFLRTHEATSLGGTIMAFVLSPFVYLAARRLIARRRAKMAAAGAPEVDADADANADAGEGTKTKNRFFRVKGTVPMTVIFVVLVAGVGFARDGIIQAAAQSGLEAAFSARSEVKVLASSIAMPAVEIENVQVANRQQPMSNLFQFDRFAGGVALGPLLSGRVHIPELAVEGLRFGTDRTESGTILGLEPVPESLIDPPGPTFEEALDDLLKSLKPPELNDLYTVKEAKALEAEAQALLEAIQHQVKSSTLPARWKALQAKAKELTKVEPPASFVKVEAAAHELAAIRPDPKVFEAIQADFAAAKPSFTGEVRSINRARSDFESAGRSAAKARKLATEAAAIKKVSFTNALRVTKLLNDLESMQRSLTSAGSKVSRAQSSLVAAQQACETKVTEAAARLEAGRKRLAETERLMAKMQSDLAAKTEALTGSLGEAKKDLEAAKGRLEGALDGVKADWAEALAEADAMRQQLEKALELAKGAPGRMRAALERDRAELEQRYSMDRLTSDELLAPVIGDAASEWLRWSIANYEQLESMITASEEESGVTKVTGPLGTVFVFPESAGQDAAFWVGTCTFSGTIDIQGKPFTMTGTADNITSNLSASTQNTVVRFTASFEQSSFETTLTITPKGNVTASVSLAGLAVNGSVANSRIKAGFENGTISGSIEAGFGPSGVHATAALTLDGLAIAPVAGGLDERLTFVGDVLSELKRVESKVAFKFVNGDFETFGASVSAGDGFRAGVHKAIAGQVAAAKKLAFAEIDARTAEPRRAAEAAAQNSATEAGPAVETLLGSVPSDAGELDQFGAEALKELAGMETLLAVGNDPSGAVEQLQAQIGVFQAQSQSLDGKAATSATGPLAEAAKVVSLGETQTKALKAIETTCKKEIARLTKLR